MVGMAQLVRALGCGPGDRGFESHYSPFHIPLTGTAVGRSQVAKARDFDSRIRWFEPSRPSQKEKSRKRLFLFVLFSFLSSLFTLLS